MRTLCLSLPEQPERAHLAKNHLEQIGLDVEFICGINGHKAGLAATHPYEVDHPGTDYHIGPATIGIYLSHYIAWSICQARSDELTLILEDDVLLCDNFIRRLNDARLAVPGDWDMLFLGSCCTEGHSKTHIAGEVFDVRWPQCLHAYVLNRKAALTLLTHCRDVYAPIDCLLALNNFFGLKVYTVLPRLAEQLNTNLPP
jgi:GR25 family glycosyltransferase involved in LPS biosynthesis